MCWTLCRARIQWQTKPSPCLQGSHAKSPPQQAHIHTIPISIRSNSRSSQVFLMDLVGKQNCPREGPHLSPPAECFPSGKRGQYWYFGHRLSQEKEGRLSFLCSHLSSIFRVPMNVTNQHPSSLLQPPPVWESCSISSLHLWELERRGWKLTLIEHLTSWVTLRKLVNPLDPLWSYLKKW